MKRKNDRRLTRGEKIFNAVNLFIMILVCIIVLLPLMNVVSVSISADRYVAAGAVTFYPRGINFESYKTVFASDALWRSFINSVEVTVLSTIPSLIMTSLAAYPMAFGKFYGKRIYTFMILLTMWFTGGIIPTFMVVNKLGLVDSIWALVVVPLITAYHCVILRSFYTSIPASLIESAKLDGANDFQILLKIATPLSKAALATIGLWIIVGRWNEFMNPIIYLKDYKKYTLQVVLRDIVLASSASQYDIVDETKALAEQVRNATIVVTMLPVLIVYPFLQKYFVKGVMIGAVKG